MVKSAEDKNIHELIQNY